MLSITSVVLVTRIYIYAHDTIKSPQIRKKKRAKPRYQFTLVLGNEVINDYLGNFRKCSPHKKVKPNQPNALAVLSIIHVHNCNQTKDRDTVIVLVDIWERSITRLLKKPFDFGQPGISHLTIQTPCSSQF